MSGPDQSLTAFSGERPVALVTGGARRVGRAICRELAGRGCDVLLTYLGSTDGAAAVCGELRGSGVSADALQIDLADLSAVSETASRLATSLPRLDILVHNASTYEPSPLAELNLERADRQYRVNALAPLALSARLAALLLRSDLPGGGAIVTLLDIHADHQPRADHAAYAMAKAALGAMTRSLALDLAPEIRVNGVAPGVVVWPDHGPDADPAMQERYLSRVPLARAGTPEDAARAVAFLALDGGYTTGHVLTVDGGRSLR